MSGLNPENVELNWAFIHEMSDVMSKRNNDGLGYTAIDTKGNMFGERWWYNHEAFDYRPVPFNKKVLEKFKSFVNLDLTNPSVKYNKFGTIQETITAITLHTRMATSGKEFTNTHPFVDFEKQTSLIHNGIIQNVTKEDNIRSTCDSERILNKYLKHEVMNKPEAIQDTVNELQGYFACGIITKDSSNKRVIDIIKTRASLYALYVRELDAMVFATSDDDVKEVCTKLGLTIQAVGKVDDNKLIRLNALTGDVLLTQEYKDTAEYKYPSYNSGYTSRSDWHRTYESGKVSEADWKSKTVDNVTDIISKHSMNSEEAMKAGYEYDKVFNMWVKKKKSV
jgi:hypothetical protein